MSVSCPQAYLLAAGTWLLELLDCPGDSDHQGQSQLLEGRDKDGGCPGLIRGGINRACVKYTICSHHFEIAYTDRNCDCLIPHLHRQVGE